MWGFTVSQPNRCVRTDLPLDGRPIFNILRTDASGGSNSTEVLVDDDSLPSSTFEGFFGGMVCLCLLLVGWFVEGGRRCLCVFVSRVLDKTTTCIDSDEHIQC